MSETLILQIIFYAYYLAFPIGAWGLWRLFSKGGSVAGKAGLVLLLALTSWFFYARFVEPRMLVTAEHELEICTPETGTGGAGSLRIAVFSDTHNGVFKNAMPLARVVARVRSLSPDFVLIPGDFTYYLEPAEMAETFAALAEIDVPVYAVMGNHDEGIAHGPVVVNPLTRTLQDLDVTVLDPGAATFFEGDKSVRIIGMKDHWAAIRDDQDPLPVRPEARSDFTILLEHNPDALVEIPDLGPFDLMVTGHTHGGQINLPYITCAWTFACDVWRYGYLEHERGNLFVTSGTGMVGLPVRINVPPIVDILNISYAPCRS